MSISSDDPNYVVIDEKWLYTQIIDKWGEFGAHAEIYRRVAEVAGVDLNKKLGGNNMDFYNVRRDAESTQSDIEEKKEEIETALNELADAKDELENYADALSRFIDSLDDLENYSVSVDVQVDVNFEA